MPDDHPHWSQCPDPHCDRFPCQVYREGYADGSQAGYASGYAAGNADGFAEGYAAGAADTASAPAGR